MMEQYIAAMKPDEVGFLIHQIVKIDNMEIRFNGKTLLNFATTTDNETFIHLTSVFDDGLVTFTDSNANVLWSNKEPIFSTIDGKTVVTFAN